MQLILYGLIGTVPILVVVSMINCGMRSRLAEPGGTWTTPDRNCAICTVSESVGEV